MIKSKRVFLNNLIVIMAIPLGLLFSQPVNSQSTKIILDDLSSFRDGPKSWRIAGEVRADLEKENKLNTSPGRGVLVNFSDEKKPGDKLFTRSEYGDIDLELDYMMAKGSNSGLYIQGLYEVQLYDSWGVQTPTAEDNGAIYGRWDPEGRMGYEGYAPRQNASRAPGLWQHLKIAFQAPRFDADGKKIENARMLRIELNGVVIHADVELLGPTRGAMKRHERARGPLLIQGDHGAVAFRNIEITDYDKSRPDDIPQEDKGTNKRKAVYPILVDPATSTVFRSFMDLPGGIRVVHGVSVGSAEQVHYTYDIDKAMIVQFWRGGFLDATPMWHLRGDGSSRPVGAVQHLGKPVLMVAKLASSQEAWLTDTTGARYQPHGYVLDTQDRPVFHYQIFGSKVTDATEVVDGGKGISRVIRMDKPSPDLYVRLAEGATLEKISNSIYLVDDQSYYLRLDDASGAKPIVREVNGRKELIIPIHGKVRYTILF